MRVADRWEWRELDNDAPPESAMVGGHTFPEFDALQEVGALRVGEPGELAKGVQTSLSLRGAKLGERLESGLDVAAFGLRQGFERPLLFGGRQLEELVERVSEAEACLGWQRFPTGEFGFELVSLLWGQLLLHGVGLGWACVFQPEEMADRP